MATVEGLFNFDEKLLARQIVKDRDSAAIGATAPDGWGPMMMGMNKLGNAIFNSDDKILREQTIAQTSLKEVMEELGDDAQDNALLYEALGQRLVENGASAETLMKLKSVASTQANEEATTKADIAYKQQVQEIQKNTLETNTWLKQEKMNAKERALFESATTDPTSQYGQILQGILTKLSGGADTDEKGYKKLQNIFVGYTLEEIEKGNNTVNAMQNAEQKIQKEFKYKKDGWWIDDDSDYLRMESTTVPKLEEDQDFLDLVEQKRTK
jgi:hypothetical protein